MHPKPVETGYVFFDVIYDDGSQRSNRRVPRAALLGFDVDEENAAKAAIEEQDREIAEKSGGPKSPSQSCNGREDKSEWLALP